MAKDIAGALETASHIPHATITYSNIADEQEKAGDVKGALETIKAHLREGEWWYDRSLQGVAQVKAERGDEKEAIALAKELPPLDARGFALLGVARGLLQRNKIGVQRP
jgi:hypothetical protein